MAVISGHGGSMTLIDGYTTNVNSWTIDYTGEALESTAFDSVGVREFVPGLTGWSGSYECFLDTLQAVVAPGLNAKAALFTASTGVTFGGDVLITSVAPSTSVDAPNAVTISFQGTGVLEITASTTTT